ncbi:MAG: DUF4142 domain-containing protein [Giesbergeria sp.]|nr:DUF4142 domain-containing protein [Giesbergeria sp.]
MNRIHCRPSLITAALVLAFPLALSAQTAPAAATRPDASATTIGPSSTIDTHANPGVPAAGAASDGQRNAALNRQGNGNAAVAKADRDFMHKAAGAGLYEVEVSRLATERAQNADVRAFAEKMVNDHTDANQELAALAKARGVDLPQKMPDDKRKVIERLQKSNNFDRDYVDTVGLKDHKADIALFDKAHRTAKDQELKTWAGEKLPTLQTHLKFAQELNLQRTGKVLPGIKTAPVRPEPSSLSSTPDAAKSNR